MGWIWEKTWDEKVILPKDRTPSSVEADFYRELMSKIEEKSEKDRSSKQVQADS